MEYAFLWFEVEVVKLRHLEDVVDCAFMIFEIGTRCDTNVIHVNVDCRSERLVFEYDISIYCYIATEREP